MMLVALPVMEILNLKFKCVEKYKFKIPHTTPQKFMLTFKLKLNKQTFNKNMASAEKSPMLKSHKSLQTVANHKITMKQIITIFLILLSFQIFSQSSDYENAVLAFRSKNKSIDIVEYLKNFNQCIIGKKAPNFIAKTTDGKTIELNNLKENVVVINFWFISCSPCVAEIPGLNDIAEKYKTDKIQFIGITRDNEVDLDKFYKTKVKFNFKTIPNNKNIYNTIFMLQSGFPTTILIDKEGIIRLITSGGRIDKNASDEIKSKLIPYIEKYLVE